MVHPQPNVHIYRTATDGRRLAGQKAGRSAVGFWLLAEMFALRGPPDHTSSGL
ncbi:hypothetical protein ZHAS_00019952 [Anopheles sinensis]|uniref:Uncharacterized protein n=1 Tax=Anopheles sinensis TaxID=74873 RepID=A0A084WNK4_ANOSI|nr:hypothetical protein ZHAS_00019952 [Anopheles sinensis]